MLEDKVIIEGYCHDCFQFNENPKENFKAFITWDCAILAYLS